MKKGIALAMTALLLLVLTVPTFAAEANNAAVLYKANPIVDPNLLLMRAELGVDERSEAVKAASTIHADIGIKNAVKGFKTPEILTTTQLLSREKLPDGKIVEEYSTVAIARSVITNHSATDQSTSGSVTVYATVNYKAETISIADIRFGLTSTEHRVIYPTGTSISRLYMENVIDNSWEYTADNSRSVNNPSMGTWYTLSSPSSAMYDKLKVNMYAFTTAYLPSGAQAAHVRCWVQGSAL